MFILNLFWNTLAAILLIVVLILAGFGAYSIYENKHEEVNTTETVLMISNDIENNNNF